MVRWVNFRQHPCPYKITNDNDPRLHRCAVLRSKNYSMKLKSTLLQNTTAFDEKDDCRTRQIDKWKECSIYKETVGKT